MSVQWEWLEESFAYIKTSLVSQWTFLCSSRYPVTSTDVSFIMVLCGENAFWALVWIFLQSWKRGRLTLRYCTFMGLADGLLIASSSCALFRPFFLGNRRHLLLILLTNNWSSLNGRGWKLWDWNLVKIWPGECPDSTSRQLSAFRFWLRCF